MTAGSQSETGRITRVLLKHPREAFASKESVQAQWRELYYTACPDYDKALWEYDRFLEILSHWVPEIHFLPRNDQTGLDSVYVRDPAILTRRGAILCNMGKKQRQKEPLVVKDLLDELGVPILGEISGAGKLEGGDIVWIDEKTLAVGRGYRTNDDGIRQLRQLTRDLVDELIVVPLPHWNGPQDVLHLMSLLSPIDRDLAVVYSRLLPVFFRELLAARGISLLEVDDPEYQSLACNVLAVAPRKCIMISGNHRTRSMLEDHGAEVWEYDGEEISRKGAGGPTCLTRPLHRE